MHKLALFFLATVSCAHGMPNRSPINVIEERPMDSVRTPINKVEPFKLSRSAGDLTQYPLNNPVMRSHSVLGLSIPQGTDVILPPFAGAGSARPGDAPSSPRSPSSPRRNLERVRSAMERETANPDEGVISGIAAARLRPASRIRDITTPSPVAGAGAPLEE